MRHPRYNCAGWCGATEYITMQQAQLGMCFAAVAAWVVCGCILTRKPKKSVAVPDEHQPVVSLSKKKGAVIGLAAAYRSLKKLDRLCDHLLSRDEVGGLLRIS